MTITAISPEQSLSGHKFPGRAAVMAEAYWWHLAALRQAPTRERAAHHVQALASAASQVAVALPAVPGAAPGTGRDPLAWAGLATCLSRLALALRGGRTLTEPEDSAEESDGDHAAWQDLAQAAGRREFAMAWCPIGASLFTPVSVPAGGEGAGWPPPGFTVAQLIRAAAAAIDAPW